MLEGQVDDAVGRRGAGAQAVEVVEAAAVHLGARGGDRLGRGVGAGEADDLVAGIDELGDDGGADPAACAGDEYAHESDLLWPGDEAEPLMSVADIDGSTRMSVTDITRTGPVGRWEPDARGRLSMGALELFAEHGFEQTTVADIAERAGVTERTFFRHFADKREVLFMGSQDLQGCGRGRHSWRPPTRWARSTWWAPRWRVPPRFLEEDRAATPGSAGRSSRPTRACRSANCSSSPPLARAVRRGAARSRRRRTARDPGRRAGVTMFKIGLRDSGSAMPRPPPSSSASATPSPSSEG